jgi:oxygen-independent coproporphyrinogen-3 oxidase
VNPLLPPPLGLYIHLPWCERKCPYCDFNSHEAQEIPESAYVTALLDDLEQDCHLIRDRSIDTVFIGGGTPSLFSAAAISRLLQGIRERVALAIDAEITMEANPGSAETAKFAGFRRAGVNRLSLGIQSFDDNCLQRLGRVHDRSQALAAVEMARSAGFDNFNLDLMHGLPGQALAGGLDDLHQALALQPPHLSWYQLTIEPNTVFHKRPPLLPVDDELAAIQEKGEGLLAGAGYRNYEVSAWSRPGRECRHNLNYWRFGDYLGIGAGAHGKISFQDGRIVRYAKRRQPAEYLASTPEARVAERRELGPQDRAGEFMLNALRLTAGVPDTLFTARTGLDPATVTPVLESLVERGLLLHESGRLATSDLGRRFLDDVVAEFFPD